MQFPAASLRKLLAAREKQKSPQLIQNEPEGPTRIAGKSGVSGLAGREFSASPGLPAEAQRVIKPRTVRDRAKQGR
jgi:hypothetical protein